MMDIQPCPLDGITEARRDQGRRSSGPIQVDFTAMHGSTSTEMGGNRTRMETQGVRPQTDMGDLSLRTLGHSTHRQAESGDGSRKVHPDLRAKAVHQLAVLI